MNSYYAVVGTTFANGDSQIPRVAVVHCDAHDFEIAANTNGTYCLGTGFLGNRLRFIKSCFEE